MVNRQEGEKEEQTYEEGKNKQTITTTTKPHAGRQTNKTKLDRKTDTVRDRQTGKRQKNTDRQRQTERQDNRQRQRDRQRKTNRQTGKQRQTERQTNKKTDRHIQIDYFSSGPPLAQQQQKAIPVQKLSKLILVRCQCCGIFGSTQRHLGAFGPQNIKKASGVSYQSTPFIVSQIFERVLKLPEVIRAISVYNSLFLWHLLRMGIVRICFSR